MNSPVDLYLIASFDIMLFSLGEMVIQHSALGQIKGGSGSAAVLTPLCLLLIFTTSTRLLDMTFTCVNNVILAKILFNLLPL